MEMVTLRRSVPTDVGEIAPGTRIPAVPSLDGGWLLELSLPAPGVPSHPVEVPASAVDRGRFLLSKAAAHHDYRFAREVLGYSNRQALAWLMQGYGVSERQLLRWGFHNPRTEMAS